MFFTNEPIEVSPAAILRFEGNRSYTTVYLLNGSSFQAAWHVGACLSRMPDHLFIRVHKLHAINQHCLSGAVQADGQVCALLSNGDKVPVSKREQTNFEALLQKMGLGE